MTARPDDPELSTFARAQRGELVLDDLVAEHLPQLRAYVRAHMIPAMRARESAADIVQTVCRALLAERDRFDFRGEVEFRAWLFTAARRKIFEKLRFHRRGQRDLRREAMPLGDSDLGGGPRPTATPSAIAAANEQLERLEAALDVLSPDDREVIALSRFAELPVAEVAARMQRSEAAVRKLLGRAVVRLTRELRRAEGHD